VIFDNITTYIGPRHLRELIIPFTGWCPSMTYGFSLVFVFMILFSPGRFRHLGLVIMLVAGATIEYVNFQGVHFQQDFGNPYLKVSSMRYVWTSVVPLLWAVLMLSPRMFRYCKTFTNVPRGNPS
jgi:hypothetical protein